MVFELEPLPLQSGKGSVPALTRAANVAELIQRSCRHGWATRDRLRCKHTIKAGMDKEIAAGVERLYRASVRPAGTSSGSTGAPDGLPSDPHVLSELNLPESASPILIRAAREIDDLAAASATRGP